MYELNSITLKNFNTNSIISDKFLKNPLKKLNCFQKFR